jgi:hypothetical protein
MCIWKANFLITIEIKNVMYDLNLLLDKYFIFNYDYFIFMFNGIIEYGYGHYLSQKKLSKMIDELKEDESCSSE